MLTVQDFEMALARTRITPRVAAAARLVILDRATVAAAARLHGIKHRQQLNQAVQRIRRAAKPPQVPHTTQQDNHSSPR